MCRKIKKEQMKIVVACPQPSQVVLKTEDKKKIKKKKRRREKYSGKVSHTLCGRVRVEVSTFSLTTLSNFLSPSLSFVSGTLTRSAGPRTHRWVSEQPRRCCYVFLIFTWMRLHLRRISCCWWWWWCSKWLYDWGIGERSKGLDFLAGWREVASLDLLLLVLFMSNFFFSRLRYFFSLCA